MMIHSIFPSYQYSDVSEHQKITLFTISKNAEGFLRFLSRTIQNYPSHGIDHSVNIIRLINDFTEKWEIDLNPDERFILYAAAWLHDIGCIRDRKQHNILSAKILLKNESICNAINDMDNDLLFILKVVIESHSSSYDIDTVPLKRGTVRVRLISAIFRLLDACEITNVKCPRPVFEEIKEDLKSPDGTVDTEAIEFWEGHMNIKYIGFSRPNIEIITNDFQKTRTIIDRLKAEIGSIQHIFQENEIEVPVVLASADDAGIE